MTLDFSAARLNMIDSQVRTNDVPDLSVQDAMAHAPRERFCPAGKDYLAYADAEIEYAPGWFLMTPRDVAKLLHSLSPRSGEKALCIAAPYAAMALARMGVDVTLVLPEGAPKAAAEKALAGEGVKIVGGELTALPKGDYDLAIVEGAVTATPDAWTTVADRLGVIERKGPIGKAIVYRKSTDGTVGARESFDATPPVIAGFAPQPAFTF